MKKGVLILSFALIGFLLASSAFASADNQCGSSGITGVCNKCGEFNSAWSKQTDTSEKVTANKIGSVPSKTGYYHCDDYAGCSGSSYNTRLCDYEECHSNADCSGGKVCVSSSCISPSVPGVVFGGSLDNGLVSYWSFNIDDGSSSSLAVDVMGTNDGEVFGLEQATANGINKEGYYIPTNGNLIRVTEPAGLNFVPSESFTISAWVNLPPESNMGLNTYDPLLYSDMGGDPFTLNFINSRFYAIPLGTNENNVPYAAVNELANDNQWHHYVTVVNISNPGTISVYKDGILKNSASFTSRSFIFNRDGITDYLYLGFGNIIDPGTGNTLANSCAYCKLDEIGFWNRALSPAEIEQVYEFNYSGRSPVNLTILTNASWANLKGESITRADLNDTVMLKIAGTNLTAANIGTAIYKLNSLFFGLLDWSTLIEDALKSAFWSAGRKSDNTYESGAYYFKANLTDSGTELTSGNLDVLAGAGGGGGNAIPRALITLPAEGFISSVNYTVAFTQASSDEDDLLRLTWKFGDGSSYSIDNYSLAARIYSQPGLGDAVHNYSAGGTYRITLNASEMIRKQEDIDARTIHIFERGINVVPVITSPEDGTAYGTGWIWFNASKSYAVNCSDSCELGKTCSIFGNLACYNLPKDSLRVTWNVTTNNNVDFYKTGNWSNYTNVEFIHYFPVGGEHIARLNIRYQ